MMNTFVGRFPELNRLDSKADRRKLWKSAVRAVLKSWRYWTIALGLQFAVQLACRILLIQCLAWLGLGGYHVAGHIAGAAIGGAAAAILTLWLVRRRIQRNLRLQLIERGEPVCLTCGYDLRGQKEARCPECGTPFDESLLSAVAECGARPSSRR